MAKKKAIKEELATTATKHLPPGIEKFSRNPAFNKLDEIFPGNNLSDLRTSLLRDGVATYNDSKISADFDKNGHVMAIAAAVPRTPTNSEQWLRDNVPDFSIFQTPITNDAATRKLKIDLFYRIARQEGMVNNAIKKAASLVSQAGSFKVRYAKQGKRPEKAVTEELLQILSYWQDNVNSSDLQAVITGSRGIKQIIRRGSRQAMIEGDLFLRQIWDEVKIPLKSQKYSLPMLLQAIPAADIYIPRELGAGMELFYWRPTRHVIQYLSSTDPNIKKIIDKMLSPKVLNELKKKGMVLLDPALLTHVKHGGTDTDVFGQSMVEPAMTDLSYSRALKMLDFVTIGSLINRMLIIKIGDKDPQSDYHNLAVAQARVNTFRRLITGDIGPNMMIVWAGHDIEKLDVSAHEAILDTDKRHELAAAGLKMALGVPDSILLGSVEGGARGAGWLGFVALYTVAEELREEFAQVITQLGNRIAIENGFDQVDLTWEFSKSLLADREANSKIMVQAYDRGLLSRRSMLEELDKNYDAERIRKEEELETDDLDLFIPPPVPMGGPGGNQGTAPAAQPGRPSSTGNPKAAPPPNPATPTKPTKKD